MLLGVMADSRTKARKVQITKEKRECEREEEREGERKGERKKEKKEL